MFFEVLLKCICVLKDKIICVGGIVDTVQDFLIKLGMKPRLHILEISIFPLNHVTVRPTKIMNNLLKVYKICTFKIIFWDQKSTEYFLIFFCEKYLTRRSTFMNAIF